MEKQKKKQYWLYVDSFIHISVKKEKVLFYNPYTGKILEYSDKPQITKLARRLISPRNLRVIRLSEVMLSNPSIDEFINHIRQYFIGDLLDVNYSEIKPVQMPPIVKIQKDVKYLKSDESRSVGENIMEYLSAISLYINDQCERKCSLCRLYYRQFQFCTATKKGNKVLDIETIRILLEELRSYPLSEINILAGDIFAYSKLDRLLKILRLTRLRKIYFLHYLNAVLHRCRLKELTGENTILKIPVTFPVDEEKYKVALQASIDVGLETVPIFAVQNEEELNKINDLLSLFPVSNSIIRAVFNKQNMKFIIDNIFIDRYEVEAVRPSLKDIYINQSINLLDFGKLTVLSSGKVYANVNTPVLGKLGEQSIHDLLLKEMKSGKSWTMSRLKVTPCRSCTFENICPPVSNYNRVIRKNNLCHIIN